jgi:hypothetical protein
MKVENDNLKANVNDLKNTIFHIRVSRVRLHINSVFHETIHALNGCATAKSTALSDHNPPHLPAAAIVQTYSSKSPKEVTGSIVTKPASRAIEGVSH